MVIRPGSKESEMNYHFTEFTAREKAADMARDARNTRLLKERNDEQNSARGSLPRGPWAYVTRLVSAIGPRLRTRPSTSRVVR